MFYGWIPTNKDRLEYSYISYPKEIRKNILEYSNKDAFFISLSIDSLVDDFYNLRDISRNNKIFINKYAEVTINRNFIRYIKIFYNDIESYSNFKIYRNGIVHFLDFKTNTEQNYSNTIHQIMFNLTKLFVHGDIHHHQKIDISLPITYNKFNPMKIAISLLNAIKLMESTVKKNNNCESDLKNKNFIYEMDGYLAYLDTFSILFPSKNIIKQVNLAKNISTSLKSIIAKREEKKKEKNYFFTILFTFIGFFISTNILLNGFWFQKSNDLAIYLHSFSREIFSIYSFLILLISYFYYLQCKFRSYLYYHFYDFFEKLRVIKYAKKSDLNLKGNLLKSFPLLLFIVVMYLLLYYLMKTN